MGAWRLSALRVDRAAPIAAAVDIGNSPRERFAIVVRCYPADGVLTTYEFLRKPPSDSQLRARKTFEWLAALKSVSKASRFSGSWSELAKPFQALPDRVNEWTITLPKS